MKISIFISVLILTIAAGLGWKFDRWLAAAQTDEKRLAAEARRLGVLGGDTQPDRSAKRYRPDRDAEARQLAVEYHTEAKIWESVVMMDSVTEERYVEFPHAMEQSSNIIFRWAAQEDPELASAPEGPARNAAIRSYAETVFKHDPETAMQWIMTLPPGKDRDVTLKHMHLNWPQNDPAGKEAFAKKHGIK